MDWIGSVLKIKSEIRSDPIKAVCKKTRSKPIQTFAVLIGFQFGLDWFDSFDWIGLDLNTIAKSDVRDFVYKVSSNTVLDACF